MIKVLFIAYNFPPIGGAGVQRALKFVQYLSGEGFLPVVLTGQGSSGGRWDPCDTTLLAQVPSNIVIHRAERPSKHTGRIRQRLQDWFNLPSLAAEEWIRSMVKAASHIDGVDLIFVTMSPFWSCEVAIRLSNLLGVPWVADLRDPWALDEMQVYPTFLHRKLEMQKMRKLLATAAMIVMNTREATAALKAAFPEFRDRNVRTITNGFDKEDFATPLVPRSDSRFRIVHSGYLHTDEGLRRRLQGARRYLGGAMTDVDVLTRSHVFLLEAVDRWQQQRPEIKKDYEIVFVGETSAHDRAFAERTSVAPNIRFAGYLPHDESVMSVRTADLLFLPMHNLPKGKRATIVPGKTYEYMASGRPILAAVPEGDADDYLRQCGTAMTCRPDDVAGMIQCLDQVYSAWQQKVSLGHMNEDFVNQFERRSLTHALATAFKSVLGDKHQLAHAAN